MDTIGIETKSDQNIKVNCTAELMRPQIFTLPNEDHPLASSFSGGIDGDSRPTKSAEILVRKQDVIYKK